MSDHKQHQNHDHRHGADCGHKTIRHGDHSDYLHDGHMHHMHENHIDECSVNVSTNNPEACTPSHNCGGHDKGHPHTPNCGHEAIPHGSHTDYLVAGHLHHAHSGHCDDHGTLKPS